MFLSFDEVVGSLSCAPLPGDKLKAFGIYASEHLFVPPRFAPKPGAESDLSRRPSVMLISARGAAGKSRVARELSKQLLVPLWLLEDDDAVSGAALERALVRYLKSPAPENFIGGNPASLVIIDSLDEARSRVSGQSWGEFLASIVTWSEVGLRFVLLGRERTLEDVWATFADAGVSLNWFEISHFDPTERDQYIDLKAHSLDGRLDVSHAQYRDSRDAVTASLVGTVGPSGSDAFVGYAPVLDAVAALLAKTNLLEIQQQFDAPASSRRMEVLNKIINELLIRDQDKVAPIARDLDLEAKSIYTPDEQIDWLCRDLEGGPEPKINIADPEIRGQYVTRVTQFLDDHPFRSDRKWASPVFVAYVAARRLDSGLTRDRLLEVGNTSGLLFDFVATSRGDLVVDEQQFAALHSSVLASEWGATEASVELSDVADDSEAVEANLAITQSGAEVASRQMTVALDRAGVLRLHGPLSNLTVTFPGSVVVAPTGSQTVVLGPDLYIEADSVDVPGNSVEFARRKPGDERDENDDPSVVVEVAQSPILPPVVIVPPTPPSDFALILPRDIHVSYPWHNYRQESSATDDSATNDEAARFLKKLMSLTRTHGHKGGARSVFLPKFKGRQPLQAESFARALAVLVDRGIVQVGDEMVWVSGAWEPHRFNGKQLPGQRQLGDVIDVWGPVLEEIRGVI